MSLVSKGSCVFNLTLGYDLTKSQKYHSFQEWGDLEVSQNIIPSLPSYPLSSWYPLVKYILQNAIVGMKVVYLGKDGGGSLVMCLGVWEGSLWGRGNWFF